MCFASYFHVVKNIFILVGYFTQNIFRFFRGRGKYGRF
eukprot:UN13500